MMGARTIMTNIKMTGIFGILFAIAFFIASTDAAAVMSVDIGSEWMKAAIVSPGVPMEIALNKESKRKTHMSVAFRDNNRLFGEDAQSICLKMPQNCFSYFVDLLGKSIDNPMVDLYKKRFPHHDIIADDERNTINFRMSDGTLFSPEELLAQMLQKAREYAEISANHTIKEAVIIVPGFFNQAERRAVMAAAELIDLNVLQLINDYTAIALYHGIFRRNEINDTAHILFYDMGASSTTASIVKYHNIKPNEKNHGDVNPQLNVVGVGYDRTLGGLEIQVRLQNYMAKEFEKIKTTANSVFKNARSMAKLFKEAARVKNILSANMECTAQIENLLDNENFKLRVTRETLIELSSEVLERLTKPIEMALVSSGLTLDQISKVVFFGAKTRMPIVNDLLTKYVGTEPSKCLNADEAAVLGAVYKAADLSVGFKVQKFVTKDAVLFPVQTVFEKSTGDKSKQVRQLFGKMNSYPQKKVITFNKRKSDFSFGVNYADLDYLPVNEIEAIGNLNLSVVEVRGVAEALDKVAEDGAEPKGIKAHFDMDKSGLLHRTNVELIAEKTVSTDTKDEGTLSKIGSKLSQLFSGSSESETVEKTEELPKEDTKPVTEDPENPAENQTTAEKSSNESDSKSTQEPKPLNQNETDKSDKKITVTTIKIPIETHEIKFGPQVLSGAKFVASREKIRALHKRDVDKANREMAFNNLESFAINAQEYMSSDEFINAAQKNEIEKIVEECQKVSEWLYDDGIDETQEVYEKKLGELRKLSDPLFERVREHRDRPEVLAQMASMINASRVFLSEIKSVNETDGIFTVVEVDSLERYINDTHEYHETVVQVTQTTALNEPVQHKVKDILHKMSLLDREVKYLITKAKIRKPKVEANATSEKVDESSAKPNTSDSSEVPVDEEPIILEKSDEASEGQEEDAEKVEAPVDDSSLPPTDTSDDEAHEEL